MAKYSPLPNPLMKPTASFPATISAYPGVDISAHYDHSFCKTVLTVSWLLIFKGQSFTFVNSTEIDDSVVARYPEPPEVIYDKISIKVCEELVASLPEELVGKYPFTRIYHDLHLRGERGHVTSTLFGFPDKKVEGWVHNKFRHQKIYPRDGTITPVALDINGESVGTDLVPRKPKPPVSITRSNQHKLEEAIRMAKVVKKPRTVSTIDRPIIDPNKVKKPECSVHGTKMKFEPTENKWVCTTPNCSLVKRPKRDKDDKHVVLGKGNVELRYIQDGSTIKVILISDDNVALDITPFVDMRKLEDESDLFPQVEAANAAGSFNIVIPVAQEIPMKMKMVVMGVPDIASRIRHD